MLSSNNINIDVDNKLLYNIPISILDSNSQISKVRKSKYICLMLLFSNFTNYENDRFKFKLVIDNNEITDDYCFEASIPDKQLEYLEELYSWIIDDGDNYIQKLSIVRSVLLKNKSFTIENSLLNSVKSIFQRIINSNVDRYFNQVALLKDDFLKIVERENDIYQSLHLKLIGWFSALALLVFDKIKDYSGSDIFYKLLMSDSQKTELLIIMLIFALVFILIIYVLEIRKNQDEYIKLKLFYTNSLMFDDGDFEEKIKSPCLDFRYILFMLWIVAILFLKLFTFNRNFICYSGVLTLAFLLLFGVIKLKKDKN
jgi:sepS10B protein